MNATNEGTIIMHTKSILLAGFLAFLGGCANSPSSDAPSIEVPGSRALTASQTSPASQAEKQISFQPSAGAPVEAYEGFLQVPENRTDPDSRMITLRYVRFPATVNKSGAPIIYLSGGPGGSGINTAKGPRFALFMAMRAFGDVIAFDQRGTGASSDLPRCVSSIVVPSDRIVDDATFFDLHRQTIPECRDFWETESIDLAGYTTRESAKDLDALRQHLGAEKISLWGISYGSHLALAALKQMDHRIDRIVLASVEGLAQTVKMPARTDAYFDRLQAAINSQPKAQSAFPDVKALIARVHAKLDTEAVMLNVPQKNGESVEIILQSSLLKLSTAGSISDPGSAAQILGLYAAIDADFYDPVIGILQRFYNPADPISWSAMSLAMDIASGIEADRLAEVEEQAQSSVLGTWLNFPMPHLYDAMPDLVLDADFRTGPDSAVPTLVLSGTLDGRTYPESQKEAIAGLSNVQIVTVKNAGHNLFMTSPQVTETIKTFMRGEALGVDEIIVPLPDLAPF